MNLPNLLTIVRIVLTPLMVIFIVEGKMGPAFATFAAAGLSDGLDGFLARYLGQKTEIGAILDPLADKLLLNTAYCALAAMKMIPAWLAVVVLSRDFIIVFGVLLLFLVKGGTEIRPSLAGKLTTCLQLAAVVAVFSAPYLPQAAALREPLYWGVTAATVVSGLHYLAKGLRLL